MLIDDLKVPSVLLLLDQFRNKSTDGIFDELGAVFVFSRIFIDRFSTSSDKVIDV